MSHLADSLVKDAKAYKSGGKKKVRQQRLARKKNQNPVAIAALLKRKDYLSKKKIEELANLFKEFCGYLDHNGKIIEGQSFPPPIDQKGKYLGILDHELAAFKVAWKNLDPGVMYKWARGYGKTFVATWFIEFTMFYFGFPWMYLSSTDILSDVAFWIFKWANNAKLIASAIKGGKKNTFTEFELTNGGRMRIFDYLGEELVGQHGWFIAMDDIIKKKWQERPSENLKAIRQWLFSIQYIRRKGLLIFGTRKFQGDLLEFLEESLVKKGLVVDILVPYVMEGTFPKWIPKIDPITEREILRVPELYTYEELETKKATSDDPDINPEEAWEAEMMQNPMPTKGGLADEEDIHYVRNMPLRENVRMICIAADMAWTDNTTSDNSAIVSLIMHEKTVEKKGHSRKVIEKAFCVTKSKIGRFPYQNRFKKGKLEKYGILNIIQQQFEFHRRYFMDIPIIIAIERNGAGIILIDQAIKEKKIFPFASNIIEDSSPAYIKMKTNSIRPIPKRLGITHSKEKTSRIFGELESPIKSGQVEFLEHFRDSELISEITTFPKGRYKDGPDALGMGKDELNKRWGSSKVPSGEALKDYLNNRILEAHRRKWRKKMLEPWEPIEVF